jgi:hypothetical protein
MFEGQAEKRTDFMIRKIQFHYANTNALQTYRRPAEFLAFLERVELMSLTLCQVNTAEHAVLWLTQMN